MRILLMLVLGMFSASSYAGVIPGIEVGPSVRLLDVPHPLSVGLEARMFGGLLGISVHQGMLPQFKVNEVDVKLESFDVGVKVHPFLGSFYVGALVGNQKVSVASSDQIQGQRVDFKGEVKGNYVAPHIGWQWQFSGGLFLGMHLGWQINSGADTSVRTNQDHNPVVVADPDYQRIKNDVVKTGNDLGNTALPNVGLLQLGWMF